MNKDLINLYNILLDKKLYKYSKIINKEIIKMAKPAEPFLHWFKGAERVYIPYNSDQELNEKILRERHPIILECIRFMGFNSDEASLYKKLLRLGERSKKKFVIGEFFFKDVLDKKLSELSELNSLGDEKREFIDRAKNMFLQRDSFIKIPKFIEEYGENIDTNNSIKIQNLIINLANSFKKYSSDNLREGSHSNVEKMVVISRNERDVAHMSTDRNWTSCMNLSGGDYSHMPHCEVENGGFIAYLIDAEDLDINNPYSRILIRRFDSNDGNSSIALVEDVIYGIEDQIFLRVVQNWVDKKQGIIELGEYTLSGMDYSDVYDTEGFYGIPKDLNVDKIISNPNILFEYSEKIYLLKDNAAYQVVMETMPDLVESLNIFSKHKMFSSEEEMNSFVAISKDNSKKIKSDILRLMAIYRAIDEYSYDFNVAEEFIDDLEYDEERFDSYNEEVEDENDDLIEINKFDTSKPYYTFEKEIIKMIDGTSNRYDEIILNRHEYFDNISKYKPAVLEALVDLAIKESKRKPNSLSSQSLISIRRMSESGLMRGHHLTLSVYNPDSANQDLLFKFVKEKTKELQSAVDDCTSMDEGKAPYYSDLDRLNRGNFSYISKVLNNSSNKEIIEYINKEVEASFKKIIDVKVPEKISKKIDLLNSILIKFTDRTAKYDERGNLIYQDPNIGLTLNNDICELIFSKIIKESKEENNFLDDRKEDKNVEKDIVNRGMRDLFLSLILVKCKNKKIYLEIMKSIYGIVISYPEPFIEGSMAGTAIRLNSLDYERPMIQVQDYNFLKFLNNNKEYIGLDSRIDIILEKCKSQIAKEIENYKLDLEEATDKREIRFLRADIREKLKAIGDFSKELIKISS